MPGGPSSTVCPAAGRTENPRSNGTNTMQPPANAITYEHNSIDIDAPPAAVYGLVSDITRMGEWSSEAIGGEWLDGGSGNVGDRFNGHNRAGEREWTRECEVAKADVGEEFTFVVGGVEANCTWWSYEVEPNGSGTTLTERWWIVNKTPAMQTATDEQFAARIEKTKEMLRTTLASIKAEAEGAD